MSQTSCIRHPAEAWFLKIYQWQLDFCDGNACAAALMSYFEFRHNGKIQQLQQTKLLNDQLDQTPQDGTQAHPLLQWHTSADLEKHVLIYKRDKIAAAIKLLKEKGVVQVRNNPDPSRWWDRTQYFLFQPATVNAWIDEHYPEKNRVCIVDKSEMPGEMASSPSINGNSKKQARKIGNVPKNTEDKETKKINGVSPSPAKRKVRRGSPASLSSLLFDLPEQGREAKKEEPSPERVRNILAAAADRSLTDFTDALVDPFGLHRTQAKKMMGKYPIQVVLCEANKLLRRNCPNRAAYLIKAVEAGGWPEPKGHTAAKNGEKKRSAKPPPEAEPKPPPNAEEQGRVAAGLAAWLAEQGRG